MPKFRHNWITNLPAWLDVPQVRALVNKPNLIMLEIGSFEGRGTLWFLDNILTDPSSRIYCVDPLKPNATFNDPEPYADTFFENIAPYGDRVRVRQGFSTQLWGTLLDELSGVSKPDLIYIDGSHAAEDVLMDSALAWRLSKQGTILVWDDYADPQEALAVDAFLQVMGAAAQELMTGYQKMAQRVKA